MNRARRYTRAQTQTGFTLIELMVALLLGLIVVAGVISIFLANQRVYRTNNALGEVEDNARVAFEMLARDIREATLLDCNSSLTPHLDSVSSGGKTTVWWGDWGNALHGYHQGQNSPSDPALIGKSISPVPGSDSIELLSAASPWSVEDHDPAARKMTIYARRLNLKPGNLVLVCDPEHVAWIRVKHVDNSHSTFWYSGNIGKFRSNAQFSKLSALDWYIGSKHVSRDEGDNVYSLYRVHLETTKQGRNRTRTEEMVRHVTAMQIRYHIPDTSTFVKARLVKDWSKVDAVQVKLSLESSDQRVSTDAKSLTRDLSTIISIRNRIALP